jgi:conjugative relaxase-like TrwC/TraI family protein
MLSLGIVSAGGVTYYLDTVASGLDDYYLASAPGWWAGRGAEDLGLAGPVEDDVLLAVLDGVDPTTGARLGGRGGKVAGFDLTFSAPKSVSVLAGLADPDGAARVVAAHERAVRLALAAVEEHAARGRRGAGGLRQVETSGVTAAAFTHHTSRAGDPQLHTHVLVANRARGVDGTWGGLYGQRLFAWAKTAGHLYQAALRAELTEELGATWGPVHHGSAELAWYRRAELLEFSQRRAEITRALVADGRFGPKAAQVATLTTRPAKPAPLDPAVQVEQWRARAAAAGFHPDLVDSSGPLVRPGRPAGLTGAQIEAMAEAAVSPAGLTATRATFDQRDVLQAVADAAVDGARPDEIATAARELVGAPELVETALPSRFGGTRWTTAELLAIERRLLDLASAGTGAGRAVVDPTRMADVVQARPSLTEEQRRMVEQLCRAGDAVDVVVGRAGTGKTFALEAAHAGWTAAGVPVIGTALSARAAGELASGTGMPAVTIARLLADLDTPGPFGGLAPGSVVVVDEAGMVGTRTLARLAEASERAGAKLVLVGDPRQLPELEAGGALAALASRLPAVELTDNRRQRTAWERAALDQLRHGDVARAVSLWRDHDRITLAPSADAARQLLVDDWYRADRSGDRALMVALTRADVDDLNGRARERLRAEGHLPAEGMEVGGKEFAVGDRVLTLRNDRRLGVVNGGRATVIDLQPDDRTMTVCIPDPSGTDDRRLVLPEAYLAAGHLSHGYATTVHKAQGATVARAFVLGSTALYREAGYTAMSRATDGTELYQVAPAPTRWQPALDPTDELARLLGRSKAQQLAATLVSYRGSSDRDQFRDPDRDRPSLAALHARRRDLDAQIGGQRQERWPARTAATTLSPTGAASGPSIAPCVAKGRAWVAATEAIHLRERDLTAAAVADPGAHLRDRLGPPPLPGPDRDRWIRVAGAIEIYRDRYHITTPDALGPRPADPEQSRHHDVLTALTLSYEQHLDRHLDQGMSL